jgi:hypothetical protein
LKRFIFPLLLLLTTSIFGQAKIGYGGSLIYNLPINEIGLGLRMHYHIDENWFIAPQASYFPGLNRVHEAYGGVSINYNVIPETFYGIYATAGAFYNGWFNHENFNNNLAQLHNFNVEFGFGTIRNRGCWRPFAEYRANSKWWESNLRVGVLVYFGDCKNDNVCPAYTRL